MATSSLENLVRMKSSSKKINGSENVRTNASTVNRDPGLQQALEPALQRQAVHISMSSFRQSGEFSNWENIRNSAIDVGKMIERFLTGTWQESSPNSSRIMFSDARLDGTCVFSFARFAFRQCSLMDSSTFRTVFPSTWVALRQQPQTHKVQILKPNTIAITSFASVVLIMRTFRY